MKRHFEKMHKLKMTLSVSILTFLSITASRKIHLTAALFAQIVAMALVKTAPALASSKTRTVSGTLTALSAERTSIPCVSSLTTSATALKLTFQRSSLKVRHFLARLQVLTSITSLTPKKILVPPTKRRIKRTILHLTIKISSTAHTSLLILCLKFQGAVSTLLLLLTSLMVFKLAGNTPILKICLCPTGGLFQLRLIITLHFLSTLLRLNSFAKFTSARRKFSTFAPCNLTPLSLLWKAKST